MSKFGKELIDGMKQAAAHAGGRKVPGMRVKTVEIPDVKGTQHRFAALYRIPLATLRNWEQGRRFPDAPARCVSARDTASTEGSHGSRGRMTYASARFIQNSGPNWKLGGEHFFADSLATK
jgi:putative transcriptional regulator